MNEELQKLVDETISNVDIESIDVREVMKDIVENAKAFSFRMLISTRLMELAFEKQKVSENPQ